MTAETQGAAYEAIRQPRRVSDFDWVMFTDGSCWDKKERVYGGAAWLLNMSTRTSVTTTAGGTDGSTDRAELLAMTNGLRVIHEINDKVRNQDRVLWVTDRESLALQVAINPETYRPFYSRTKNLDLWASFDFFLKDHLKVTTLFSHRNTVYGQCVVDHLSRLTRNALTRQFPGMSKADYGDYSLWGELMKMSPVDVIMKSLEATQRRAFKSTPFDTKAEVTELPTIGNLLSVIHTTVMPVSFNGNRLPEPQIP